MKTALLSLVAALTSAAGIAGAQQPSPLDSIAVQSSERITVKAPRLGLSKECAPPNNDVECAAFHKEIRRNFNRIEIGILLGATTAYAGFYETSYGRTQRRYEAFARAYDEVHLAAFAAR